MLNRALRVAVLCSPRAPGLLRNAFGPLMEEGLDRLASAEEHVMATKHARRL